MKFVLLFVLVAVAAFQVEAQTVSTSNLSASSFAQCLQGALGSFVGHEQQILAACLQEMEDSEDTPANTMRNVVSCILRGTGGYTMETAKALFACRKELSN